MLHLPRSLKICLFAFLLICISALSYSLYFYFKSGLMDGSSISSVHEASIFLDELKKKNPISKIQIELNTDSARDALRDLNQLEEKIRIVNRNLDLDAEDEFLESFSKTKKSILGLISYPEVKNIIKVYKQKAAGLIAFVEKNNWKTLTRISKRVKTRLDSLSSKKSADIEALGKSIKNDFEVMKKVTMASVLPKADKELIEARINAFGTEIKMLDSYTYYLKKSLINLNQLSRNNKSWLLSVSPLIEMGQLTTEKKAKQFVYILMAILAFSALSFFVFIILVKRTDKKIAREHQLQVTNIFTQEFISKKSNAIDKFNDEYKVKLSNVKSYVQKRMSFGTIFQDALPFPAILLNSNLQTIWANSLFYDTWDLKDKVRPGDDVSWDYIQQFTNIGEEVNPIYEAFNNNISGIYQIQIRPNPEKDPKSYEMYVSPVEHEGQKRIMVFFYSLSSMEETLVNQSRILMGPVEKMLKHYFNDEMHEEYLAGAKKDFDIAGTTNVYEAFIDLYDKRNKERDTLITEVGNLEEELLDKVQTINELQRVYNDIEGDYKVMTKEINSFKQGILSVVDSGYKIQNLYNDSAKELAMLVSGKSEENELSFSVNGELKKLAGLITFLDEIKSDLKKKREDIFNLKAKIFEGIDKAVVGLKSPKLDTSSVFQELISTKTLLKDFNNKLIDFEKIAKSMDVHLAKIEMFIQPEKVAKEFDSLKQKNGMLGQINDSLENRKGEIKQLAHGFQTGEEHLIGSLKNFYGAFKHSQKELPNFQKLAYENKDEVEGTIQ